MNTIQLGTKFKSITIVVIAALTLITTSCNMLGSLYDEWRLDLPNGYYLLKISTHNIKMVDQSTSFVPNDCDYFVQGFFYNERYVCLKCIYISDAIKKLSFHELFLQDDSFFILYDTLEHRTIGFYTSEAELESQTNNLEAPFSAQWTTTEVKPNKAYYN
ncbi:MAG: hypothetical protein J5584_05105 [Clostridia bacterium]|nr:hypothetical protein [Clostridia bacterium]